MNHFSITRGAVCFASSIISLVVCSCGSSSPVGGGPSAVAPQAAETTNHGEIRSRDPVQNVDPFASFESSGPEMTPWEREQSRLAGDYLHSRRHYDDVLRRIRQYHDEAPPPRQVETRGKVTFSLEEPKMTGGMKILRRDGKGSPATLFQIGEADSAQRVQIDFMRVSRSGKFIAVGISEGGTEETAVHVLDAHTGKDLGDRSYDVRLGNLVWLPDASGYLYMRGRGRKGVPLQDQSKDLSVGLHHLHKPADQDVEVVGARAAGSALVKEYQYPSPSLSPDGRDIVISVQQGVNPDLTVFAKRWGALLDEKSQWTQLYDVGDHVRSATPADGRLLVVRNVDDATYVLEEVPFERPSSRRVLYTSKQPLEDVIAVRKDAYVIETNLAAKGLVAVRERGEASRITLPSGASVSSATIRADPSTDNLVLDLKSWTEPRSWWTLAKGKKAVEPLAEVPSAHRTDAFEVHSMEAVARDGERIPLTVVSPKGVSPKFVWISTYGSYGMVLGPIFTPPRRVFLEEGGTYVFAHVRGGGEKGRTWHEQARGPTKIKTVEDFIDAVKYLRGMGFGKDGGVFVSGASAGGIPVGGLLAREPQLADAVYAEVGAMNVSRLEAGSSVGALHKDEFGTMDTPEGARHMREIDAYLNIRDGVPYPATLLHAMMSDARVPRWQSTKFVARLQQATSGKSPILLRLSAGGHVSGMTPEEDAEADAEIVIFALANIRHPDFQ